MLCPLSHCPSPAHRIILNEKMRSRKAKDLNETLHLRDKDPGSTQQGPFQNVCSQPQDIPCCQTGRAVVPNPADQLSNHFPSLAPAPNLMIVQPHCLPPHATCLNLLNISHNAVDAVDSFPMFLSENHFTVKGSESDMTL